MLRTQPNTAIVSFFNGTFRESFDAVVTSDGATVTMSLEQSGTGDLTMQFSSGISTLDCTPADTIALTAGSDASPTENYIYVLQSTLVLTKSTSDWPSAEHIKVGYFLVPSAGFVQTSGVYINQNWNDHLKGTDNQGHLSHMAERSRRLGAIYASGIDGNGTDGYLTPSPANVELKATAGVIFQMHKHTVPAFDTSTGGEVLVKNWSGDAYHNITNLFDIVDDSTGTSIGANKYFNLVVWAVGNKGGEYTPMIINLPSGSYANQSDAENDVDGHDDFTIPTAFVTESSTGFLIARITCQKKTTWVITLTKDLRGTTPSTASGGPSGAITEFADNTFRIFDETDVTKIMAFDVGTDITTATTRTYVAPDHDGTMALRQFFDDEIQLFGDGSDVSIQWDGTDDQFLTASTGTLTLAHEGETGYFDTSLTLTKGAAENCNAIHHGITYDFNNLSGSGTIDRWNVDMTLGTDTSGIHYVHYVDLDATSSKGDVAGNLEQVFVRGTSFNLIGDWSHDNPSWDKQVGIERNFISASSITSTGTNKPYYRGYYTDVVIGGVGDDWRGIEYYDDNLTLQGPVEEDFIAHRWSMDSSVNASVTQNTYGEWWDFDVPTTTLDFAVRFFEIEINSTSTISGNVYGHKWDFSDISASATLSGDVIIYDLPLTNSITATNLYGLKTNLTGATNNYALYSTAGDIKLEDDVKMYFGTDDDYTIEFDSAADVLLFGGTTTSMRMETASKLEFRDSAIYLDSPLDGYLYARADIGFVFDTPTVWIGTGAAGVDYALKFDGENNDGIITWKEDEDYFAYSDDILLTSTEHIYFSTTSETMYSSGVGTLDIEGSATLNMHGDTITNIGVDGDIDLFGSTLRVIGPTTDLKADLGDATHRFNDAHIKNLYMGGIVSVTTTANSTASATTRNVFDEDTYTSYTHDANVPQEGITYTTTDGRFTVDSGYAGLYVITCTLNILTSSADEYDFEIREDGVAFYNHDMFVHTAVDPTMRTISVIRDLADAAYIEVWCGSTDGVDSATFHGGCTFTMHKIGAT